MLAGFEISCFSAAKGGKPAPICLFSIFGKIDEKSGNPVQAFHKLKPKTDGINAHIGLFGTLPAEIRISQEQWQVSPNGFGSS